MMRGMMRGMKRDGRRTAMKGREALEKWLFNLVDQLTGYAPPEKDDTIMSAVDGLLDDKILEDMGWASPETIAKDYVRLDMVIGTRIINKRNKPDCWKSGCALSCPDGNRDGKCVDIKPKTVADLIGGKG